MHYSFYQLQLLKIVFKKRFKPRPGRGEVDCTFKMSEHGHAARNFLGLQNSMTQLTQEGLQTCFLHHIWIKRVPKE